MLNFCFGCFQAYNNLQVEVALFKKFFEPNEKIQALVNFDVYLQQIKKVTMSLYIKIEVKNPDDYKTMKKYSERIYQVTFDSRSTKKDLDSTIMEIDLEQV